MPLVLEEDAAQKVFDEEPLVLEDEPLVLDKEHNENIEIKEVENKIIKNNLRFSPAARKIASEKKN